MKIEFRKITSGITWGLYAWKPLTHGWVGTSYRDPLADHYQLYLGKFSIMLWKG